MDGVKDCQSDFSILYCVATCLLVYVQQPLHSYRSIRKYLTAVFNSWSTQLRGRMKRKGKKKNERERARGRRGRGKANQSIVDTIAKHISICTFPSGSMVRPYDDPKAIIDYRWRDRCIDSCMHRYHA